jgi:hypothetical protein
MPRTHPYFRSPEEMKELIELRDKFAFDSPRANPSYLIFLAGPEGVGKTHTACTMAELGPVYVLDTEYRADIVTRKFNDIKHKVVRSYRDMVIAVKAIIKHHPKGTIVFDSGTDLQTFAEIDYLEETNKTAVGMPWNWAEVWARCNTVIDDARMADFNIVVTSRVKDEYAGEKPTGREIPRIYSSLPYKADLSIQWIGKNGKRQPVLVKNGFSNDLSVTLDQGLHLPTLIARLSQPRKGTTHDVIMRQKAV